MTDHHEPDDGAWADERGLHHLLAPADVWVAPPVELEARVVGVIRSEAAAPARRLAATPVMSVAHRSTRWWLAAAAACVLVVAAAVVLRGGEQLAHADVTLVSTAAAPGASGRADLTATPSGLKILLDVEGLGGAPADAFYEAWISDGTTSVSAGTFHLRGGSYPIELWAGVDHARFTRLAITLEPLDGDAGSSGDVRLVGEFRLVGG